MKICKKGLNTIIIGENYQAEIIPEKFLVVIRKEEFYYGMSMFSSVNIPCKKDISSQPPEIIADESQNSEVRIKIICDSNIWKRKTHYYTFREDSIEFYIEISGDGTIDRVYYFRGVYREDELASIPGFNRVFSPQANFMDKRDFFVNEFHSIAAGNYKELNEAIWGCALHGAPLCFVFHKDNRPPFMSAGLLTHPGENMFHAFEFNYLSEEDKKNIHDSVMVGTEAFSLKYDGHLHVKGSWRTPVVSMRFAEDKESALKHYLCDLEKFGGIFKRKYSYEKWTYEPVFCTWHEQVALGINKIKSNNLSLTETERMKQYFDVLSQEKAVRWLSILKEHDIRPGSIILDAKWQIHKGDSFADPGKFPNMREFVDYCHAEGVKVILWFNAWDREGIPDEECCIVEGKPDKVDPTNPLYIERLKTAIRRMLSHEKGCYNADGLKVDGTTGPPVGRNIKTYRQLYGFELSRALLELIYTSAKEVKKESVIGLFTASPYFADLCDFARTGDLYSVMGDPNSTNEFRIWLQNLVMPDVAKDTDGALRFNYILDNSAILNMQEKIGVPCIYQAEYLIQRRHFAVPDIRLIEDELYKNIADSWKRYKRKLKTL